MPTLLISPLRSLSGSNECFRREKKLRYLHLARGPCKLGGGGGEERGGGGGGGGRGGGGGKGGREK